MIYFSYEIDFFNCFDIDERSFANYKNIKFFFKVVGYVYIANNIRKAIINENKAVASVSAKPKIQYLKSSSLRSGFLDNAIKKHPNTIPVPALLHQPNQM